MINRNSVKFLGTFNRTDQEDPLKAFRYHVEIEEFARFGFSKVGGLKATTDVVEYREGGKNTTPTKSPGLTKFANVEMERGVITAAGAGDEDVLNWYVQIFDISSKVAGSDGDFRRSIDIVLFDKEGFESKRWRVVEAWPSEVDPTPDLEGLSSNNVIEKMTITHEGFSKVPVSLNL